MKLLKHKAAPWVLLVVVVVAAVLYIRSLKIKPTEEYTREMKLLDMVGEAWKAKAKSDSIIIVGKDDIIRHYNEEVQEYKDQIDRNNQTIQTIRKQGNEKINRIPDYTDSELLRYLSKEFGDANSSPVADPGNDY